MRLNVCAWFALAGGVSACVGDSPVAAPTDAATPGMDTSVPDSSQSDASTTDAAEAAADQSVNGTVLDTFLVPRPGAKVSIGGTVVTTDAAGKFTISPVTTPYDVVVADVDPSAQHDIVEWVGLTTRTPTLQDGYAGTYRQSAAVTGNLTGVTFPGAATSSVAVFFDSARGYHYAGSHIAGNQVPSGGAWGAANVQGIWFGGATQTGTVYTLYWSNSGGAVTGYLGFGSVAATLTDAAGSSGLGISLTSPSSLHDTGNLNLSGLTASATPVTVYFHPDATDAALNLEAVAAPGNAIDVLAPSAAGLTLTLSAAATDSQGDTSTAWKARMTAGTLFGTIVMPTPIAPSAPADNATNVDLTTTGFTWSKAAGTVVYHLMIACGFNPESFQADIFTTGTSLQLLTAKALSGLGAVYPTATQCLWQADAVAPAAGVDDFAGAAGWLDKLDDFTATADGSKTTTKQRKFTTP